MPFYMLRLMIQKQILRLFWGY